jgi:hypothetical protein
MCIISHVMRGFLCDRDFHLLDLVFHLLDLLCMPPSCLRVLSFQLLQLVQKLLSAMFHFFIELLVLGVRVRLVKGPPEVFVLVVIPAGAGFVALVRKRSF